LRLRIKIQNQNLKKVFLDYIHKIRNNFKNFLSEVFSTKKDSSEKLNNLKEDISNNNEKEDNETDTKIDSAEKDTKNLKEKLKEICVRSRKY